MATVSGMSSWGQGTAGGIPGPLPLLQEPQCIVETDMTGKLVCVPAVLEQVSLLDKPLVSVAIAGLYRTGKSYLMNRIAGRTTGFALGSTIQPKTKGIWVLAVEHPLRPDRYMLLLDTEGLGDAFKGDRAHDTQIFCLATLMSSVLVYNGMNVIDEQTIEQLQFIAEMSKHIRSNNQSPQGDDEDFDWHFPNFVVVLRDFSLDLEYDEENISPDQYLEKCLQLKNTGEHNAEKYNLPRTCIRKYFKNRRCFTFDRPASKSGLKKLEELTDEDLSPDFVEDTKKFLEYITQEAPVKHLSNGRQMNGSMWSILLNQYVTHIRNGAVPCIEDAVSEMSQLQNTRTLRECLNFYREVMFATLEQEDEQEAVDQLHVEAVSDAMTKFINGAIFDEHEQYLQELMSQIQQEYKVIKWNLEKKAYDVCYTVLQELKLTLMLKVEELHYMCPGGFTAYKIDLQVLINEYLDLTRGSIARQRALDTFKLEMREIGDAIRVTDDALDFQDQEREAAIERADLARRQQEMEEREREMVRQRARRLEEEMARRVQQLEERRAQDLQRAERRRADLERRAGEELGRVRTEQGQHLNQLRDELNRLR